MSQMDLSPHGLLTSAADMKELALEVSTDIDQKFELALSLDDLDKALSITKDSAASKKGSGVELKWRTLGDRALALWKVELAAQCFKNAGDLPALLLVYTSIGDKEGMAELAELASACCTLHLTNYSLTTCAENKGLNNVAFAALLQMGDTAACVDLLLSTDRIPEAALFARTYAPSQVSRVVKLWKADLEAKKRQKIAVGIADPDEEDGKDLFENWEEACALEGQGGVAHPATNDTDLLGSEDPADLVEKLQIGQLIFDYP